MSEEIEADLPPCGGYGALLTLNDIDKGSRHQWLVFCKEDPKRIVGEVIMERKMGWVGVSFSRDNELVKCRSSHLIVLPQDNKFSKGDHVPSEYVATLPLKKPAPEPAAAAVSCAVIGSQDRASDSTANINRAVTDGSDGGSVMSKRPASTSTAVFRSQGRVSTVSTAHINRTVTAEGSDEGSAVSRFSVNESSDIEVGKNMGICNKRQRTTKAVDDASDSDESLFSVEVNDERKPPAKQVNSTDNGVRMEERSTGPNVGEHIASGKAQAKRPKTARKKIKPSDTRLDASSFGSPTVREECPDDFYMKIWFGNGLLIDKKNYSPKMQKSQIGRYDDEDNPRYELFYGSNCQSSSQYFETLAYDEGPEKGVARLQLTISAACKSPGGKRESCIHALDKDVFTIIEDDGHESCGFISESLLHSLLGGSTRAKSKDAFQCQVRFFSPTKLGIGKGMLTVKEDLDDNTILIPTSMIKVQKSRAKHPLHDNVILVISSLFLSDKNITIDRLIGNSGIEPSDSGLRSLEPPSEMFTNLLISRGVPIELLDKYLTKFKEDVRCVQHASVVGVADPYSCIPQGYVFVSGLNALGGEMPKRILITRSPCTEGRDAMVVNIICSESDLLGPNAEFAYKSLSKRRFGSIVFPLGEPSLPSQINSSDLDGDMFFIIWHERIVDAAVRNYKAAADDFLFQRDDLVGTTIQCNPEGQKSNIGTIVGKASDGVKYLVEVDSKPTRMEVWSKESLLDGRDYMKRIIGHVVRNKKTSFHVEWEGGTKEHILSSDLKRDGTPPFVLLEYVDSRQLLRNKDCHWFKQYLDDRRYTKTLSKILDHRRVGTDMEMQCEYNDGVIEWEPLSEHLVESKILVAKYAKEKCLMNKKDWRITRNFWLEEIQETLIFNRSYQTNLLVMRTHGKWSKACRKFGPNSSIAIIWGRAYKQANELEKHVGTVKLPLMLYREIAGKDERKCKFLSLIEPIDAYVWPPLESDIDHFTPNLVPCREAVNSNEDNDGWGRHDTNQASNRPRMDADTNDEDNDGWGRHDTNQRLERDANKGPRSEDNVDVGNNGWGRRDTNQVNHGANEDVSGEDDGWGRRDTNQHSEGNGEDNDGWGRHDTNQGLDNDDANDEDNDGWGRHDTNQELERDANNRPPNEDHVDDGNDGWGRRETNHVNLDANEDVSGNELYSDNDNVEQVAAASNKDDSSDSDLFSEDDEV